MRTHHATRWRLILPVLFLMLAAATRLSGSSTTPVWTDEGWTAWATVDPNPAAIVNILATDRHPPLYFVLLGAWRFLTGESRLALRALSIFSGILATALVYRLGTDTFDRRAGRFAAALFAVLPLAVYFTQAARHYGLLVLLALLSTLLLRRAWRVPRLLRLTAYGLSVALLLYTHYEGIFLLGAHALGCLLLPSPRTRWRTSAALLLGGLVFGPWVLVILTSQGLGEIARASSGAPGTYATTPADLLALGGVLFGGQLALLGGAFLLGAGPALLQRRVVPDRWLVLLAGGGLLLVMALGNLFTGLLTNRTIVMLTPFLLIVAGAGLAGLPLRAGQILTGAAVIVMLAAPGVIQPHLPFDAVAAAVAADYSPGDLIVLETGWDDRAAAYELGLALPPAEVIATLPWVNHVGQAEPALPHVQPALETVQRVWVIQWFQAPTVLPYLQSSDSGFRQVITHAISTGPAYTARFPGHPLITAALFERVAADAAGPVFSSEEGELFALVDALLPPALAPGAALHVDLWWSALAAPPLDYSVGVYLLDEAGQVMAQHDGPPGGSATTAWPPGALHFDRHTLALPPDLPAGDYVVGVSVYWYGDNVPLTTGSATPARVGSVTVRVD